MAEPSTSPSGWGPNGQGVNVAPASLEDAAQKLDQLYQDNDGHQMYLSRLTDTASDTIDQMYLLEDQYNILKTLMGKLIDGSRQFLRGASSDYQNADNTAAKAFGADSVVNGGKPQ